MTLQNKREKNEEAVVFNLKATGTHVAIERVIVHCNCLPPAEGCALSHCSRRKFQMLADSLPGEKTGGARSLGENKKNNEGRIKETHLKLLRSETLASSIGDSGPLCLKMTCRKRESAREEREKAREKESEGKRKCV